MSTTNEAFIKAYRADAAADPRPIGAARHAVTAACRTSVEFVSPDYASSVMSIGIPPAAELESASQVRAPAAQVARRSPQRSIGKRPLSSFLNDQPGSNSHRVDEFTPETIVSAFRWPRVCRALWDQYHAEFDRVAEMLLAECQDQPSLIGMAGVRPGDGCTTNLLCLAMSFAARDAAVIVVDANFAAPRLAHRLGVEPKTTWQEVLAHGVPIAEAVIRSAADHVDLLPLAGHTYRAAELAAGLQPAVTAGVLRHAYAIALVDLGATLDDESQSTTSRLIRNMRLDGTIFVTDAHRTDADALDAASELLRDNGCPLIGAIENRVANSPKTSHAETH